MTKKSPYKVYCARGRMENLIKEHKLHTRSDRTSCHRWQANQFRLFLHTAAYWLLLLLRGAAPKRSPWRGATFETIRRAFLKVAVRVEQLKTRIRIALPTAFPNRHMLVLLAARINAQRPVTGAAQAAVRATPINPKRVLQVRIEPSPSTRPITRAAINA